MNINKKLLTGIGLVFALIAMYFIADSILFDGFKSQKINEDGFEANYFATDEISNQPAIILIGGGYWGDYWGEQFVNKGYVGLSLKYTGINDNADFIEEIPLEYFERAIHWLAKQKEVNPDHIIVMGASRNAELALLLASKYPNIISGAIAYAPSSVVWSNTVLPYSSDDIKPSWTINRNAVPYIAMDKIVGGESPIIDTKGFWMMGLDKTEEAEKAEIQVEKINGPILLFSGLDDNVWPSALMADMIEQRLIDNSFKYIFENIQYDNAGHLISLNPDSDSDTANRKGKMVLDNKTYEFDFGGTQQGDNDAKKSARYKVFDFLEQLK